MLLACNYQDVLREYLYRTDVQSWKYVDETKMTPSMNFLLELVSDILEVSSRTLTPEEVQEMTMCRAAANVVVAY